MQGDACFISSGDTRNQDMRAIGTACFDEAFHQLSSQSFSGMFRMKINRSFQCMSVGCLFLPWMCVAESGHLSFFFADQTGISFGSRSNVSAHGSCRQGIGVEGSHTFPNIKVIDVSHCTGIFWSGISDHSLFILLVQSYYKKVKCGKI